MPRYDTYLHQLQTIKPDYYCQSNHGTIFIWIRPDLNNENKPFITAYFNGEKAPIRFRSHDFNQQKGLYLFRKQNYRIYPSELQIFPSGSWPGNLLNFKKPYPQFLIPYYWCSQFINNSFILRSHGFSTITLRERHCFFSLLCIAAAGSALTSPANMAK